MNGNILRRRMASGKSEENFTIEHSNCWYFELTTTDANQNFNVFYSSRVGTYYLDGVEMSGDYKTYKNQFGGIIIPEAGTHKIWIKAATWSSNSGVYRPFDSPKIVFFDTHCVRVLNSINSIRTLYINRSTPPDKLTNCTKVETIYVPKEYIEVYKSTYPTLANKIKPCNFI